MPVLEDFEQAKVSTIDYRQNIANADSDVRGQLYIRFEDNSQ